MSTLIHHPVSKVQLPPVNKLKSIIWVISRATISSPTDQRSISYNSHQSWPCFPSAWIPNSQQHCSRFLGFGSFIAYLRPKVRIVSEKHYQPKFKKIAVYIIHLTNCEEISKTGSKELLLYKNSLEQVEVLVSSWIQPRHKNNINRDWLIENTIFDQMRKKQMPMWDLSQLISESLYISHWVHNFVHTW